MKHAVLFLLIAATATNAQQLTPANQPIRELVWNGEEAVEVPGGYGPRYATVYDSETAAPCPAFLPYANVIDDVNFGPVGPWATTTNDVLRSIRIPLGNSGTATITFDLRLSIWNSAAFANNPMIPAGAPLYRVTFPIVNLGNGLYHLTHNIPGIPPVLPDNEVFVQMEFFARGTTTLLPITAGNPSRTWSANRVTTGPGSSTEQWGLDVDNDGVFEGGGLGTTEHRRTVLTTGPCTGQPVNLPLILTGDVPATPPVSTDLGTLSNALNRTDAYAAGQVRWFTFRLPRDVTDTARTFLDVTTAGSTMGRTVLALYAANGTIVWQDDSSGPDEKAQLSFGIGRRAGDGDGDQFDGYDGELLAAEAFYLGVAERGTRFSDAFAVTPVSPGSAGGITLTFRSNAAGGGLSASVAPAAADMGQLVAPGALGPNVLPGLKNVLWSRFEVCRSVDGATEDSYLDIDFARSDPTGDADQAAFMFDSAGNLFAASDDDGPGLFPQFSFGHAGPRGPYQAAGAEFTGASGSTIGLGVYYLAVGHQPALPLANAESDGRFHVRPLSGDDLNIAADFYVGNIDCGSGCAACPADFDDSGGVDGADVEAFFHTWENGEACGDTNQDGSVDGADVETFFTLWEAGGC